MLKLHRYLDPPVAQNLIDKDPEYFGTDTEFMSDCLGNGRSMVDANLAECLDHFLECRNIEMETIKKKTKEQVIDDLEETIGRLQGVGRLESEQFSPALQNWVAALR
jgi:hypothetical protein